MLGANHDSITLLTEPADSQVIDFLYSKGFITTQGRDDALGLLYPIKPTAYWTAVLAQNLGLILIVCGLLHFFIANIRAMPFSFHIMAIQIAWVCCLCGSCVFSLKTTLGKIFLSSAALFTAVWLAQYHIQHNPAFDTYTLFLQRIVSILPWVALSQFAFPWLLKQVRFPYPQKFYSIQTLIDWLTVKQEIITPQHAQAHLLSHANQETIRLYAHILLFCASFLMGLSILLLVLQANIGPYYMLCAALLAFMCGWLSYDYLHNHNPLVNTLVRYQSLMLMWVGRILLLYAVILAKTQFDLVAEHWIILGTVVLSTVVLYWIYPLKQDRFLSCLSCILALSYVFVEDSTLHRYFFYFLAFLLIISALLFTWQGKTHHWDPLAFACVLGLCFNTCYVEFAAIPLFYPNLFLGLAFLLLGLMKKQPTFMLLGGLCLAVFVFSFYPSLALMKAQQAFLLVIIGGVLLGVHAFMQKFKKDSA